MGSSIFNDVSRPQGSIDQGAAMATSADGSRGLAVRIGPTSPRQYITGEQALNLIDPDCPSSGDWHMEGAWFVPAEGRTRNGMQAPLANKERRGFTLRTPTDLLGADRLFDARPSLRRIGHPEGDSSAPVWAARHDRAIVDGAWGWLTSVPSAFPGSFDGPMVAKWLWTDEQFEHLHRLAQKLEGSLNCGGRRVWGLWMRALSPDADWEKGACAKGARHD